MTTFDSKEKRGSSDRSEHGSESASRDFSRRDDARKSATGGGASPFMRDKRSRSEAPASEREWGGDSRDRGYGSDQRRDASSQERKPYRRDDAYGDRRASQGGDDRRGGFGSDRKPFQRDDRRGGFDSDRKPYQREDRRSGGYGSDRKPFQKDDRRSGGYDSDRKPFQRDDRRGGFDSDRKPYQKDERRSGGYNSDRKPFQKDDRRSGGYDSDRKPFQRDDRRGGFDSDHKPYQKEDRRSGGYNSDRKPFQKDDRRSGGYDSDRKPFQRDDRRGGFDSDRKPYQKEDRRSGGYNSDRKPFQRDDRRGGFDSDRKPFQRDDRRSGGRDSQNEEYPRYTAPKTPGGIRLNRFIATSGICSRREADELILTGLVTVNGELVTELGTKVMPTDEVRFDGNVIQGEKKVYLLMNKPKGYVTTMEDPHADKTVMDLIRNACTERVYPVGRLDKNTVGVLLFTNDGDLTKQLTHPSYRKRKIYQVSLDKNVTQADLERLASGIELEDGPIFADEISYVGESRKEVGIEIHSGRNRIVRRMFEYLGYSVQKLDRVYFAGLTKQRLKRGAWRFLTPQEVAMLKSGEYE